MLQPFVEQMDLCHKTSTDANIRSGLYCNKANLIVDRNNSMENCQEGAVSVSQRQNNQGYEPITSAES